MKRSLRVHARPVWVHPDEQFQHPVLAMRPADLQLLQTFGERHVLHLLEQTAVVYVRQKKMSQHFARWQTPLTGVYPDMHALQFPGDKQFEHNAEQIATADLNIKHNI